MKSKNKAVKLTRDYFESIAIIALVLVIMLVYTTADLDTTPPNVEDLAHSEITETSAIISWTTDEPANSFIEYGTSSGAYEYNYENTDYIDFHSFLIQELLPETTYYYRVSSSDINGNTNTSQEQQFTTLEDTDAPHYTTITQTPESNNSYNETQTYRFEVDWKDNSVISEVTITHNFNGAQTTETVSLSEENYVYELTGLKQGNYSWYMNASDLSGNTNSTPETNYEVIKAEPSITLTVNNQSSSSYSAYVNETLNITAKSIIPFNGLVEVLVDGVVLPPSGSVFSFSKSFQTPGLHEVIARFNETENYTSKNITVNIAVTSPQLILNPTKNSYAISELAAFTTSFPQGSIIEWEICGPIPIGGGFVECSIPQTLSGITSPYAITHTYTNKTGNYSIKVQASHNGVLLESIVYYSVINSINPNIQGDTEVLIGEELNIKSTASEGISPYTYQWRLSNGSIINGQELKAKYNVKGDYPANLTIIDSKGNTLSRIVNIKVLQKYSLKITVQDAETKSKIQNAGVRVDSQEKFTDSSGFAEFELAEDDYSVRIDASGYNRYNANVELSSNKSFTYDVNKSTALLGKEGFDIQLTNPYEGYVHGGNEVRLEANVYADSSSQCALYVADGTDWSKEEKTFTAQGTYKFEHLIKVGDKKKYTWNIECTYEGKSFSSPKRTFSTRGYTELTATTTSSSTPTSGIVDAGELRRQLSDALDNIAVLDLREKQVAEALQLNEQLEKALRDYDRIIRDINNLQFRNDLSGVDLDKKRLEYTNLLKIIEEETPITLKVNDLQEFVVYPKKEELKVIALHYAESTQHTGNLNLDMLSELQNSVLVKTKVATVNLNLISGQSKDITLIHKEVSYPKGNQEKTFLLESIPKEFSERADKIEYLQDYDIINNNPLVKFNNPDKITYYVDGIKDLEVAKQSTTIMFSESVFAKAGNQFTGNVILSNVELTSPAFIIGILVLIIFAYIIYAYDLHNKLLALVSSKSRRKNLEKMLSLIYDAKELLKSNEVESANLIFREIRLIYERMKFEFKKESYEEALSLYDQINVKYFEKTLAELQVKESNGSVDYNELKKLIKSYDLLEERQKQTLSNELTISYNSFVERNIRGKNW